MNKEQKTKEESKLAELDHAVQELLNIEVLNMAKVQQNMDGLRECLANVHNYPNNHKICDQPHYRKVIACMIGSNSLSQLWEPGARTYPVKIALFILCCLKNGHYSITADNCEVIICSYWKHIKNQIKGISYL